MNEDQKLHDELYLIPPQINGKNDFLGLYIEEWIPIVIAMLITLYSIASLQWNIALLLIIVIALYFLFMCRLFGKRNIYYILSTRLNFWVFSQQKFEYKMEGVITLYVEENETNEEKFTNSTRTI